MAILEDFQKKIQIVLEWNFMYVLFIYFKNSVFKRARVFTMAYAWKVSHGHVGTHSGSHWLISHWTDKNRLVCIGLQLE